MTDDELGAAFGRALRRVPVLGPLLGDEMAPSAGRGLVAFLKYLQLAGTRARFVDLLEARRQAQEKGPPGSGA